MRTAPSLGYKVHAESFRGRDHVRRLQEEARGLVGEALSGN